MRTDVRIPTQFVQGLDNLFEVGVSRSEGHVDAAAAPNRGRVCAKGGRIGPSRGNERQSAVVRICPNPLDWRPGLPGVRSEIAYVGSIQMNHRRASAHIGMGTASVLVALAG